MTGRCEKLPVFQASYANNRIQVNVQTQPDQQTPFWLEFYRQTRLLLRITDPEDQRSFEMDPEGCYGVVMKGED